MVNADDFVRLRENSASIVHERSNSTMHGVSYCIFIGVNYFRYRKIDHIELTKCKTVFFNFIENIFLHVRSPTELPNSPQPSHP